MLSIDGSSNVNGVGIGLFLTSSKGDLIQQSIWCGFQATNNKYEYEELITGLTLAKDMGIKKLDIWSDCQLVVNQLLSTYQARNSKMTTYLAHVKSLQSTFEEFNIIQVPRLEKTMLMLLPTSAHPSHDGIAYHTTHLPPMAYGMERSSSQSHYHWCIQLVDDSHPMLPNQWWAPRQQEHNMMPQG